MKQVHLACGFSLRKYYSNNDSLNNPKKMVHSSDSVTNFFGVVAEVLKVDTFVPCRFLINEDYVLKTSIDLMKKKGFTSKIERNWQYAIETITDADYEDHQLFLANTSAQAESLLHSLEHVARGIGHNFNWDEIDFICFNQDCNKSSLNGKSLKLLTVYISWEPYLTFWSPSRTGMLNIPTVFPLRSKTPNTMSVVDMTLNNLMVRFQ